MISVWIVYALSLIVVALVAASGARFRPDAWYAALEKPPGLPPNWVFPLVWSILYVLMAIAAAWIWQAPDSPDRSIALWLYAAQLLANAIWSWLFFGRHRIGLALIDLMILLVLATLTTWAFKRVEFAAAVLLWPYLLWLLVALYLNSAVLWLNPRTPKGI